LGSLLVVVEDQPFVNPVLNEQNDEIESVQARHARTEGDGDEDGRENLTVTYFEDEFWAGVEVFVLGLDDLAGVLGVAGASAVQEAEAAETN
jgi:hypothetical protein